MTEKLPAVIACSLLLLVPACGGGGGGGGDAPPRQPAGPAGDLVRCLGEDNVRAEADKAGARLIRAPRAEDAVVVPFRGNVANVLFFKSPDAASKVKERAPNEELVNIERDKLVVFQKTPAGDQEEQIKDCLDDEEGQQEDEQQKK